MRSPSLARTQDLLPPNVCANLNCCLEIKPTDWSPRLGQPGRTKTETGPRSAPKKTQRRAEIFVPIRVPPAWRPALPGPMLREPEEVLKTAQVSVCLRLGGLDFGIPALSKQSADEKTKCRGCCRSRRLIYFLSPTISAKRMLGMNNPSPAASDLSSRPREQANSVPEKSDASPMGPLPHEQALSSRKDSPPSIQHFSTQSSLCLFPATPAPELPTDSYLETQRATEASRSPQTLSSGRRRCPHSCPGMRRISRGPRSTVTRGTDDPGAPS